MSSLKQSPDRNGYLNLLILAGVDGEVGGRVDREFLHDGLHLRCVDLYHFIKSCILTELVEMNVLDDNDLLEEIPHRDELAAFICRRR